MAKYKVANCCFDQFESPVKLVQACLSAWKDLQSNFLHCGGILKHARTCFSAEMVGENSFDRCGSTVELVYHSSRAGKVLEISFDHT